MPPCYAPSSPAPLSSKCNAPLRRKSSLVVDHLTDIGHRGMDESANRIWDTVNRGVRGTLSLEQENLADFEYSDNGRISSTNT
jgi:hypothetical protein